MIAKLDNRKARVNLGRKCDILMSGKERSREIPKKSRTQSDYGISLKFTVISVSISTGSPFNNVG